MYKRPMFLRRGVRVTVLEALPQIVPAEDPAIGNALAEYLTAEGMEIHAGVAIERVERNGTYTVRFGREDHTGTATAEQLLVATGRRANAQTTGDQRRASNGLMRIGAGGGARDAQRAHPS